MSDPSGPVAIGVVVPLYQMAHAIDGALASVFAQRHPPAEVVVVDDGSTDGGPERVEAAYGDRVRVVRQANAGAGPARNRGVEALTTPWVAFLDADDHWLPDHLEALAEAVRAFPAAHVFASRSRFVAADALGAATLPTALERLRDADGAARPGRLDYFAEAVAEERPYFPSTLLMARATFLRHGGFDPAVRRGEDMEFMTRVALEEPVVGTRRVTAWYVRGASPVKVKDRRGPVRTLADLAPAYAEIDRRVRAREPGPAELASLDAYLGWRLRVRARQWARLGDATGVAQVVRVAPRRYRAGLLRFLLLAALPARLRARRRRSA